ncbi:MAG: hypothetical protein AAF560_25865 [Acidobacteriota bacterium]
MVATSGIWFGRGWSNTPQKASHSSWFAYLRYVISIEKDIEPSPELLLLEKTRLLKGTVSPSDRLRFDFETNEVQLIADERIISYSLEERRVRAGPVGNVTWSFVLPGEVEHDVLLVPMRSHRASSDRPNMIVMFQVALDDPEVWYQRTIPLLGLHLDLDRALAAGYGVYREGSQHALFLPGRNRVPLPGFHVDGRIWEFHFPNESRRSLRVHLFPMSLPEDY